jgi:hypothetical protein
MSRTHYSTLLYSFDTLEQRRFCLDGLWGLSLKHRKPSMEIGGVSAD